MSQYEQRLQYSSVVRMSSTEHRNRLRRHLGFFLAKIRSNHLDPQLSGHFRYAYPLPRLGIDVRNTAYRDCGVLRTPMSTVKATGLEGGLCVGSPILLVCFSIRSSAPTSLFRRQNFINRSNL